MAFSSRVYHQDYIARIRYSNVLPPPPNPPKLLSIPNTGLSSGHYTSAAFASRLAREQPLNIEADAELGMPINLIGIPGVFDGDESAILGLENPPMPHPHDRPLLRPLSTLGKPNSVSSGVSFLRRTEYISSDQSRSRFESTTSKDLVRPKGDVKKRKWNDFHHDEDPQYMLRSVVDSFETASTGVDPSKKDAWNNPQHPTDPELKLLDSYPLLPDLESFNDVDGYFVTKFITMPVPSSDVYDIRLDASLLRPRPQNEEARARREAQRLAHEGDPGYDQNMADEYDYELFLPEDAETATTFRAAWDQRGPSHLGFSNDISTDNTIDASTLRYLRIRAYETYQQSGDENQPYDDIVAIALHDDGGLSKNDMRQRSLPKAAYYYPVMRRTFLRPRRPPKITPGASVLPEEEKDDRVDIYQVSFREPNEDEAIQREQNKEKYLGDAPSALA